MSRVQQLEKPARAMETITGWAAPEPRAGQKTVFIIDDNPDRLRALSLGLADQPYRLETAPSAESAIRKLSSFHPDLILLDPNVPAADGTRLARHLLADEDLAAVPVLAITQMGAGSRGNPEAAGRFDGHIETPVDGPTLSGQVRAFLDPPRRTPSNQPAGLVLPDTAASDRRSQAATLLHAMEAGLPDSQFAPGAQQSLHLLAEVVGGQASYELADYLQQATRLADAATVRARSRFRLVIRLCREMADRDPEVVPGLADLRAGYLDRQCTEMHGLDQALQSGDFAALRKAGHNLKGTGAAYGYSELTDIGRALEAAAQGEDAAAVEALLDRIELYIRIVRPSPEP